MNKWVAYILTSLLLSSSLNSCDIFWEVLIAATDDSIKAYNTSHFKIGRIDNNEVYNNEGKKVGYIDNLTILDVSRSKVGHLSGQNVYTSNYDKIGYIDGRDIYNKYHQRLGYMDVESGPNGAAFLLLLLKDE